MMKDGSMTVDVLAWKRVIKVQTKGTTPENFSALLNELLADYVDVTFIDPRTNETTTSTFIPDATEAPVAFFWDGEIGFMNTTTITLTER